MTAKYARWHSGVNRLHIQSALHSVNVHSVNGFRRDRSTLSKEKRAKELRIQQISHLVNANSGYGARLLNAMLSVQGKD